MARISNGEYTQLGIGDCGHVVEAWPQVQHLGSRFPRVICTDCTLALYGVSVGDGEVAVVNMVRKVKTTPPKEVHKQRARRKPAARMSSVYESFLKQEGLF